MEPIEFYMDHRKADLPAWDPIDVWEMERALISGYKGKVSLPRRLENLFMVGAGIRGSSMFHPRDEREVLAVRDLAERIGIGMIVRMAGNKVHKVFLFGREKQGSAMSIPDIDESMGDKEFIIAQIGIANFTGHFLEFPDCCRERFVRHLMACTDQDEEAMRMLIAEKDPDPRAYFVERFVPCSPRCPNAISEGRRIEEEIEEKAPRVLPLNRGLRLDHMEEIRSGRILEEKRTRDIA